MCMARQMPKCSLNLKAGSAYPKSLSATRYGLTAPKCCRICIRSKIRGKKVAVPKAEGQPAQRAKNSAGLGFLAVARQLQASRGTCLWAAESRAADLCVHQACCVLEHMKLQWYRSKATSSMLDPVCGSADGKLHKQQSQLSLAFHLFNVLHCIRIWSSILAYGLAVLLHSTCGKWPEPPCYHSSTPDNICPAAGLPQLSDASNKTDIIDSRLAALQVPVITDIGPNSQHRWSSFDSEWASE